MPILDYAAVNQRLLARYRTGLRGYALCLVVLDPGTNVALDRDRIRPEKTVAHLWLHMQDELRRELSGVGLWIDNSRCSAAETVDLILARQDQARLVG